MRVAIGLGSNLGDRRAHLELVLRKLSVCPGIRILKVSRWYRTPPLRGGTASGWFLNGVVLVESRIAVEAILGLCQRMEEAAGRRRARFWGDRTLDLDLLVAEDVTREGPLLTLPHPGIAARPFVRVPLLEVWPEACDPRTGTRWAECPPAPGPRPVPVGVVATRRAPID